MNVTETYNGIINSEIISPQTAISIAASATTSVIVFLVANTIFQNAKLKEENRKLKKENKKLTSENKKLSQDNKELTSDNKKLSQDNKDLQEKIKTQSKGIFSKAFDTMQKSHIVMGFIKGTYQIFSGKFFG